MLFDWLVTGQVVATNPAHSVRGPKHVVKTGKTTVLTGEQTRELLDSIDTSTVVGLRDRALISVMRPAMDGTGTRAAQGCEALRSYRTEWDEKARAFKLTPAQNWAISRRRRLALPLDLLARADARARAGGEACRRPSAWTDHGSVHGPGGRLVEAAGKGLGCPECLDLRA